MAEGQNLRYAELTCTPYTSVLRGIAIEAYTEAIEDARVAAERDFGLVMRWIYDIPGESGIPAADATLEYALEHRTGRPGRLRPRRPRDRGAAGRSSSRTSTAARAAGLRSVPHAGETTGPETVWDVGPPARRGADRPRRLGRAGPRAARAPRRHRRRAGGLPDVQHRHPRGRPHRGPPAAHLRRRRACASRSTPTTRRCSPPRSTTTTRSRPVCSTSTSAGVADLARAAVDASFAPADVKARIGAEIDAYAAGRGAVRGPTACLTRRVAPDTPQRCNIP